MDRAHGTDSSGTSNSRPPAWQKMNIRPRIGYHTRTDGVDRHLITDVAAFVPWNFGLDQAGALDVFIPGALCVTTGFGIAMVEVRNRPVELLDVYPDSTDADSRTPLHDYYEVRLVPHLAYQYGNSFRSARWGDLESLEHARMTRFVKFVPGQLKFIVAEQIGPGTREDPRDSGGPYDYEGWNGLYLQNGLQQGRIYEVEYVYELPYLKVKGVDLVLCAEVWSPMSLVEYGDESDRAIVESMGREFRPMRRWVSPADQIPPDQP